MAETTQRLVLQFLFISLQLRASGAACTICPGGKLRNAKVTYTHKMVPPHRCSEIQTRLSDDLQCEEARVAYNATCCDYADAGVMTFNIGTYTLGMVSRYFGWHWHIYHFAAVVALHDGFFEQYIPNWRDFKVNLLYDDHGHATTLAEGTSFLNYFLPHVMYQDQRDDGSRPNQISGVIGGSYCYGSTVKIASGLGVFGVPIIANLPHIDLNNKQLYPTYIRPGLTSLSLARAMSNLWINLRIFTVSIIGSITVRLTLDGMRDYYGKLDPKAGSTMFVVSTAGYGNSNAEDVAETAERWDDVMKFVRLVARSEPRIFYCTSEQAWTALYWRAFHDIGFIGPLFLWTCEVAVIQMWATEDKGGFLEIEAYIEATPSPIWDYDWNSLGEKMFGTIAMFSYFGGEGFTNDAVGMAWKRFWSEHMKLELVTDLGALAFEPDHFNMEAAAWYRKSEWHYWNFFMPESITYRDGFLPEWDGAWAMFIAIGKLLAQGKKHHEIRGQTLLDTIVGLDFIGVSGRMKWRAGGAREAPVQFYQLMPFSDDRFLTTTRILSLEFGFFGIQLFDPIEKTFRTAGPEHEKLEVGHPDRLYQMRFGDGTSVPPLDTRQPCDAGQEYVDFEYGCVSCPPGRYSPVVGSQCINCAAGFTTGESSAVGCTMCEAGAFSRALKYLCNVCDKEGVCARCLGEENCDPCSYDPTSNDTLTVPIPFGINSTWELTTGPRYCEVCKEGSHAASRGTPECSLCTPGTYTNDIGAIACEGCDRAHYSERLGSEKCVRCPGGMTTVGTASDSLLDCVCTQGTYHACEGVDACNIGNTTPFDGFCTPCPLGASCNGPVENPTAMFLADRHRPPFVGANSMFFSGTDVYLCTIKKDAVTKCPGGFLGIDNMCDEGTFGLACAECGMGYFYNGVKCVVCEGSVGAWVALTVFLIVVLSLYLTIISFPGEPNGTFTLATIQKKRVRAAFNVIVGLGFSLVQFSWMFTKMSSVEFEVGLYDVLTDGGDFLFEADLINTPCTFGIGSTSQAAVAHTAVLNILPAFVIVISVLLYVIGCMPQAEGRKKWPNKHDVLCNLLVIFSTFFMIIANSAINTGFATFDHPNGESSLVAYPNVLTSSPEAGAMKAICGCGIMLWCAGGMAVVLWATWQLPRRQNDLVFRRCTLALQLKYQPSAPWWFVVLLVQKLLIALSITLFSTSAWQGVFVCAVYIIYLSLFVAFRPSYAPICFYCEILSTIGILVLFLTIWGIRPEDGGSGIQFSFAFVTYFQFILFFVLGLIVVVRNEFTPQQANIADLMKDIGGRFSSKTGFGELQVVESVYKNEHQERI